MFERYKVGVVLNETKNTKVMIVISKSDRIIVFKFVLEASIVSMNKKVRYSGTWIRSCKGDK